MPVGLRYSLLITFILFVFEDILSHLLPSSQVSPQRQSKSRLRLSLLPLYLLGTMLALTSCNGHSFDEYIGQDGDAEGACVRSDVSFRHSLCSVSQEQLTDGDSGVSLKLFWKTGDVSSESPAAEDASTTETLYKFDTLLKRLPERSKLQFAANAGMYNNEFAPIGYTVIQGQEIRSLNLKQGGGNFHLLPNGVLWWDKAGKVQITESQAMDKLLASGEAQPWYATQSGPMLVIEGKIHPKFDPNSTSLKFRNGVGVCSDGMIKFVNSDEPVSFYQFGSLFKDQLGCPNALFLDGGIASALYAPTIEQADDKSMGVMVGVVETKTP